MQPDYLPAALLKAATRDTGQKVYTFKATSDALDRQGEIVTAGGWETANYLRNPIVLDSHDTSSIEAVIGRAVDLRQVNDGLEADIQFAGTPRGQLAQQLVEEGVLRAVSVGFFPKEMTIPANTDVTITLPNEGVTMHNFSIEKLGVNVDIQPGETKEVVVNAPAGTYEIICNVPGHKEAGMVGTLTVTESAGAAAPAATAPAAATAEQAAATPPAEEAAAPASVAPVTVTSHDIFFDPKEITIPANTDVTISLPNEGVTTHDFSIDALGISVSIDPGATENVVVNAPAGTYEYYCNIPGHKAAGMVGTLTVK